MEKVQFVNVVSAARGFVRGPWVPSALLVLGGAFAVTALLPGAAVALPCGSYPYPSFTDRCVKNGLCGRLTLQARTIDATENPAETDFDLPAPTMGESLDPVEFENDVSAGGGDLYVVSSAGVRAEHSRLVVDGDIDTAAPGSPFSGSATSNVSMLAVFRVVDLLFTGPTAEVETRLHVVFDGSYSLSTSGSGGKTGLGIVAVTLGGGICQAGVNFGFDGLQQISQITAGDEPTDTFVSLNNGVLEDVDLDTQTEFVVGPFTVPTDTPLQLELWMETTHTGSTGGGSGDSTGSFILSLGAPEDGRVFDLPAGYSASSVQASIVANTVPEPDARFAVPVALLTLAVLGLRPRSSPAARSRRAR